MEKMIIREDYAPKPQFSTSSKEEGSFSKKIDAPEDFSSEVIKRLKAIEQKIESLHQKMQEFDQRTSELLQNMESASFTSFNPSHAKQEYISALQCEMEINRQYLLREIQKTKMDGSLKGHGDPFFF